MNRSTESMKKPLVKAVPLEGILHVLGTCPIQRIPVVSLPMERSHILDSLEPVERERCNECTFKVVAWPCSEFLGEDKLHYVFWPSNGEGMNSDEFQSEVMPFLLWLGCEVRWWVAVQHASVPTSGDPPYFIHFSTLDELIGARKWNWGGSKWSLECYSFYPDPLAGITAAIALALLERVTLPRIDNGSNLGLTAILDQLKRYGIEYKPHQFAADRPAFYVSKESDPLLDLDRATEITGMNLDAIRKGGTPWALFTMETLETALCVAWQSMRPEIWAALEYCNDMRGFKAPKIPDPQLLLRRVYTFFTPDHMTIGDFPIHFEPPLPKTPSQPQEVDDGDCASASELAQVAGHTSEDDGAHTNG